LEERTYGRPLPPTGDEFLVLEPTVDRYARNIEGYPRLAEGVETGGDDFY
jgi:hypothetical protein